MSGFDVQGFASNGDEAIEMFKKFEEKPDIIILDYRMPIKNGIDALKAILEIDGSSRIIFASADRTIKEKVYLHGAMGFLDKPFTHKKLVSTLKNILDTPKPIHI
jgi:two-component system chemotaxis response regulator CheY